MRSRPLRQSNSSPARKPNSFRPLLEALELRLVPASTYTVNGTGDTGTGTAQAGDLRYCINQANADPGSTIQFDATVFGKQTIFNFANSASRFAVSFE